MLGLGFAAPFVLLGFWPGLQRLLPKPGAWMATMRQALAFPMYGATVWLIWVLAQQTNATGVVAALSALVLFAFSMWLWSTTRFLRERGRAIGTLATLIVLIASFSCLATLRGSNPNLVPAAAPLKLAGADSYSDTKLAALRAANRPVFVDATAAWCITCLVNEEAVLSQPAIQNAFAQNHVGFLVADWTNRNPEVTALLEAHGRSGVPLYLYYAPGRDLPKVLPQILTEGELLATIGNHP
jgi:thiol:disulfide interchange protein DsbD